MNPDAVPSPPGEPTPGPSTPAPSSAPDLAPKTPLSWRLAIGGGVIALLLLAYFLQPVIGLRGQAFVGVLCFFGIVAFFSANLRAVNWRTVGWGVALQVVLALLVLRV